MFFSKGSHFPKDAVLVRDVRIDHTALNSWVAKHSPLVAARDRSKKRPTLKSWRMDETYLRVRGKWKYLFRAVDKAGNTLYLCGLSDGIVRQPPDSLPKRYPPTEFQN